MQDWRAQCHPTELTYFDIIYGGGSVPGVRRRFVYDPAFPPSFYQMGSSIVLLDAPTYKAIQQAIETNDYTRLPDSKLAAKLIGKSPLTQLGYAKRQLVPDKIEAMTLVKDVSQAAYQQIAAAARGDLETVKTLLQAEPALLRCRNAQGGTLLHLACRFGRQEIAAHLISAGAEVNLLDDAGKTPLLLACEAQALPLVAALRRAGAQADIANHRGITPLHCAVLHDDAPCVAFLLTHGASHYVRDDKGRTPLHLAALYARAKAAGLLLNYYVDVNAQDFAGCSPLHLAAANGSKAMIAKLMEAKANPMARDQSGRAAIHFSAAQGFVGAVSLLLDYGVPVDAPDSCGKTPLHLAAAGGRKDMIRFLLKQGASLNARDGEGCTALQTAMRENRPKIARFLIQSGADASAFDNYGCRYSLSEPLCEVEIAAAEQAKMSRQPEEPQYDTGQAKDNPADTPPASEDFDQAVGDLLDTMYEQGFPNSHGNAFWTPMLKLVSSLEKRPDKAKMELARAILRAVREDEGETDKAAHGRHMICARVARQARFLPDTLRAELMTEAVQAAREIIAQHGLEAWDSVRVIADEAMSLPEFAGRGDLFRGLHSLAADTKTHHTREKSNLLELLQKQYAPLADTSAAETQPPEAAWWKGEPLA